MRLRSALPLAGGRTTTAATRSARRSSGASSGESLATGSTARMRSVCCTRTCISEPHGERPGGPDRSASTQTGVRPTERRCYGAPDDDWLCRWSRRWRGRWRSASARRVGRVWARSDSYGRVAGRSSCLFSDGLPRTKPGFHGQLGCSIVVDDHVVHRVLVGVASARLGFCHAHEPRTISDHDRFPGKLNLKVGGRSVGSSFSRTPVL